jgi:hypothetical protein
VFPFYSFNLCDPGVGFFGALAVPNLAYPCLPPQKEVAVVIEFLHIGAVPFQSGE